MKKSTTFNQQLRKLQERGMILPKDESAKCFLEEENYYNVINGYKDKFLDSNADSEQYKANTHFNELKSLFLFDRELRFLFLKYILIFENSFKTCFAYKFTRKYDEDNAYLNISNYNENNLKSVIKQVSILAGTIHNHFEQAGAIKHHIEKYNTVPLWVLVNYLTLGNLSYIYAVLKDTDKNEIAKYYSDRYNKQYCLESNRIRVNDNSVQAALKIFNLVRNQCAHDERLFNTNYKNIKITDIIKYFGITKKKYKNDRIFVAIVCLKVFLNRNYYQQFYKELSNIFKCYETKFKTVAFSEILGEMGICLSELEKLK